MQEQQVGGELFVLQDEKHFKFKVPLQKILGFAPMFNNTCVVVAMKSRRDECVAHYAADGTLLKELAFHDSNLFPYVISSDREIIWVDNDRDLLLQWNLETYELVEFSFKYNNDTADTHEVFIFPETRLICVGEWGRHDSNYFRLTYYKYPLVKDAEPVYTFENDGVWNYEYVVRRANLKSKFVWWKCAMKQEIEFRTFELIEKNGKYEGEYLQHKVANPIKTNNNANELSVGCIWEMTPKKYMFVSITDRPHTDTEYPNALFVYEENNKIFREAKFAFDGKFRFQYIHYYSFGKTAMIRSFDFIKGEAQETPVYYIDNENECIAARSKWRCSYLNKYSLPGYDGNMIIDAEYENGDVSEVKSKATKVVTFP